MNKKTSTASRELGQAGERAAEEFLLARGLHVLARSWRDGRHGEIDLIFDDAGQIVFVEVKTRHLRDEGEILQAVDSQKLRRLRRLAAAWLSRCGEYRMYRIDVVAVRMDADAAMWITWLQGVDR